NDALKHAAPPFIGLRPQRTYYWLMLGCARSTLKKNLMEINGCVGEDAAVRPTRRQPGAWSGGPTPTNPPNTNPWRRFGVRPRLFPCGDCVRRQRETELCWPADDGTTPQGKVQCKSLWWEAGLVASRSG